MKRLRLSFSAFRQGLALAIAYLIAGELGFLLVIPPSNLPPLWPACGVALAGILVWGYRVWPGILVGSIIIHIEWSTLPGADLYGTFKALAAPLGIGMGATLQAVVGAYLVRRVVGYPAALLWPKDILKFLGLTGPLSCLLGASLSIGTLHIMCADGDTACLPTWWDWWLADVVGVVVVTPIVLVWTAKPAGVWRGRRTTLAIPAIVSFSAIMLVFMYVGNLEYRRVQEEFSDQTHLLAHAIEQQAEAWLEPLYAIQGFYNRSPSISRGQFSQLARPVLKRNPGIQALEWIPRVTLNQRLSHEAAARREGFAHYRITELLESDQLVEAELREAYYPVYYIEPYERNKQALGFDLASDATRRQALRHACASGKPIATGPITLVQGTRQQTGFLVFLPVSNNLAVDQTVDSCGANLAGFVLGVFKVSDLVNTALADFDALRFHMHIRDSRATSGQGPVYGTPHMNRDDRTVSGRWGTSAPPLTATFSIKLPGRRWILSSASSTHSMVGEQRLLGLILAGVSAMLMTFLLTASGHASLMKDLVTVRTQQLEEVNTELSYEVSERRRAERSLSKVTSKLALPDRDAQHAERTFRLSHFCLADMIHCGAALRSLGAAAISEANFALQVVRYLYQHMLDEEGERAFALVRFFEIAPYAALSEELKRIVRATVAEPSVRMKCLRLVATTGDEPRWNDCRQSLHHRVTPLVDPDAVKQIPMVAQLLESLGFEIDEALDPRPEIMLGVRQTQVFHVPQAENSPHLPHQEKFVQPYSIKSALGFGDMLPDGRIMAVIMFSREVVSPEVASLFAHLSLSTKMALLPFIKNKTDMEAQILCLDRLIKNLEETVVQQEGRLHIALQSLARSNDELDQFAAVASHDLQEPLRKIQAFGDRLKSKYRQALDEDGRGYVERIQKASTRMRTLIKDLLVLSRVTTAKQPFVSVDLNQIARDVLADLEVPIAETGAQVEVDHLPTIEAEPLQMRQLFQNLIGNSLKFRDPARRPVIRILYQPNGQHFETHGDPLCRLVFEDNGIGFEERFSERIFGVFERLHGRNAYEGTGIGLSICRRIVEHHRGWIRAHSAPDEGARFRIALPLRQGEASRRVTQYEISVHRTDDRKEWVT